MSSKILFVLVAIALALGFVQQSYAVAKKKAKAELSGREIEIKEGKLNGIKSITINYEGKELDVEASDILHERLVYNFLQKKNTGNGPSVELISWKLDNIEQLKGKKKNIYGIHILRDDAAAFSATVLLKVRYRGKEQELPVTQEFVVILPKDSKHVQLLFDFPNGLLAYFHAYKEGIPLGNDDYRRVNDELNELIESSDGSYLIEPKPTVIAEEIGKIEFVNEFDQSKTEYFSRIIIKIPGSADVVYDQWNSIKDIVVFGNGYSSELNYNGLLARIQEQGQPWNFSIKKGDLITPTETIIGDVTETEFDELYAKLSKEKEDKVAGLPDI